MSYTYARRKIDLKFNYDGQQEVTLRGLRVSVSIHKTGMPGYSTADIRVYGMSLSLMNALSTLGKIVGRVERKNIVSVSAGDYGKPAALIYIGTISEAWADFAGVPEAVFQIQSFSALIDKMKPVPPTSYAGSVDAATVIQTMATSAGYGFENNGVSVMIDTPYYPGTIIEQMEQCARTGHFNLTHDMNTVAIWPIDGTRGGQVPKLIASARVGYPNYTGAGVAFKTLYNPQIIFGGTVEIDTIVAPAKGKWVVNVLNHTLESETPGGAWFTEMEGYRLGESPTVPK
jgi:hypothetical protein